MINNQDKQAWCEQGENDELLFIETVKFESGMNLSINPEKNHNKYATDLVTDGGIEVDLKHVTTPFFKAGMYGKDPQHTVTLNHKDYIRYMHKYSPEWSNGDMAILFWVQWEKQKRFGVAVDAVDGVWGIRIRPLDEIIRSGTTQTHEYQQRKGESGSNARHSWLIDLRLCNKLGTI